MNKGPMHDKKNKIENGLNSAGKIIRLYSDPAVKVLKDYILHDFHDPDEDDLFGIYEGFVVLIETDGYSACEVIANTATLVRNVDPDIDFIWTDLVNDSMSNFDGKLIGRIYNLIGQSEDGFLMVNVINNLPVYLKLATEGKAPNYKEVLRELRNLHCIYIISEKDLPLFSEMVDRENFAIKIWLCRQPDQMDIEYLDSQSPKTYGARATVNEAIFTGEAKLLIKKARQISELWGDLAIDSHSLLLAAAENTETGLAVTQCLNLPLETLRHLRADREWKLIRDGEISGYPFESSGINVVEEAIKLASVEGYPDRQYPGLVTSFHLVCAIAMNSRVRSDLGIKRNFSFEKALEKLAEWYHNKYVSPSIDRKSVVYDFIFPYQGLQRELMGHVFGQNEALVKVFEYLCNDEIRSLNQSGEKQVPRVLLFYGSQNSGKAYLGSMLAEQLERPLMQLDLAVFETVAPRPLNKFVMSNWKAILVLENIDQAEPQVLKLICRILDQGKVYDDKLDREIEYDEATIILTTTLDQNMLDFLPRELMTRLTKGQLIPFHDLKTEDLINICKRKFTEYAKTVEKACEKTLTYDPLVPYCLLFSEGGDPTAPELTGAVERLVGAQVQKFANCFTPSSGEHLLTDFNSIHFTVEMPEKNDQELSKLFIPARKPKALLLADSDIADQLTDAVEAVQWTVAGSLEQLAEAAADNYYDFALLDLWFNVKDPLEKINIIYNFTTNRSNNVSRLPMPALSGKLFGDEYLKIISGLKERMPVVMINIVDLLWIKYAGEETESQINTYLELADELRRLRDTGVAFQVMKYGDFWTDYFLHLLSSAGARGVMHLSFDEKLEGSSLRRKDSVAACLEQIWKRLHYEKMADELASHHKKLTFIPVWKIDHEGKVVVINLEDLRLLEY